MLSASGGPAQPIKSQMCGVTYSTGKREVLLTFAVVGRICPSIRPIMVPVVNTPLPLPQPRRVTSSSGSTLQELLKQPVSVMLLHSRKWFSAFLYS